MVSIKVSLNDNMMQVLVANRGEIAVRVFRALHEMNIKSVAVYAKQDIHSIHRQKVYQEFLFACLLSPSHRPIKPSKLGPEKNLWRHISTRKI